jgi:asparagine synthase (glutamine-hydrolysing)
VCGIYGYFNEAHINENNIFCMMASLDHRGKDSQQFKIQSNKCILGHNRLSIIDLSTKGIQPFISQKQDINCSITYNGEVYNFKEIRQELKNAGYKFESDTDTEVVLYAYHKWGSDCVRKFNGMFAFVIADLRNNSFFIARDRYGTKPLYYLLDKKNFIFASEPKAILEYDNYNRRINLDALYQYFTFQNIFTYETLFDNIHLFPAGHYAIFDEKRGLQLRKYWDWNFDSSDFNMSFEDTQASLRELFEKAVKRQLVSDVPVGSYLSGGMDSGTVAAIAGKNLGYRLNTFTGGFDLHDIEGVDSLIDERQRAELIAHEIGSNHYSYVVNHRNLQDNMKKLVYHLDDLRLSFSYPNFYVSELASKYVKVCLSGAGGDELFSGYPWRYKSFEHATNKDDFISAYYNDIWNRTKVDKDRFFHIKNDLDTKDLFEDILFQANQFNDFNSTAFYFEAKHYLQGFLLVGDRMSMAHTMEERFPFLDNDLVDFAMRIPTEYKLKDGKGKHVLREAMKGILPDKITQGRKQGFVPPENTWYREHNYSFLRDTLLLTNKRYHNYVDKDEIAKILVEHKEGKNHRLLIWALLSFSYWCEEFQM